MHKDFTYWKQQHDSNALKEFNNDPVGLLWLKLKSIVRRGIIDEFLKNNQIRLTSTRLNDQFQELFRYLLTDVAQSHTRLNEYQYITNRILPMLQFMEGQLVAASR